MRRFTTTTPINDDRGEGLPPGERAKRRCFGVTLIELLLALAIVGILAAIAAVSYGYVRDKQSMAQAIADIKGIEALIERFSVEFNRLPDSLTDIPAAAGITDPWGNPYQYLNITTTKGKGKVRKDHNLVPLNTDYDLYSLGEDGRSASPLTSALSRDDIVRANNGAFVGLATDY